MVSHTALNGEASKAIQDLMLSSKSHITLHQVTGYVHDESPRIVNTQATLTIEECLGIEMHLPTILAFFKQLGEDEAEDLIKAFKALSEEERNGIIHEMWRIVGWNTDHEKEKEYPLQFLLENLKKPSVQAAVWSYIETLKKNELLM